MNKNLFIYGLFLLLISCNYSPKSATTASPGSRSPASVTTSIETLAEGLTEPDQFLTEGEINEKGEVWIYSIRDAYAQHDVLRNKVQEAISDEAFPEKLKHELETIDYDHKLEKVVKTAKKGN